MGGTDGRGDGERLLARYAWSEADDPRLDAMSITLVQPADGSAIRVLGPRREFPHPLTVAQALDETLGLDDFAWGSVVAQVDRLGDWDAIIEPNGWAASMPETLAQLSAAGVAVNVFWNVEAVVTFGLARAGALVREFNGLLYNDGREPLPEEDGLAWGVEAPRASCFAVMERVTGITLERDWLLNRARATYVVPL